MKFWKTAALLLSGVIAAGCFAAVPFEQTMTACAASTKTIYVNSDDGMTAADIQDALKNAGKGATVRVIGSFFVRDTIRIYDEQTLDATGATIRSNSDLVLVAYGAKKVCVRGGYWRLGNTSQLIKLSQCDNCTVENVTTSGGGNFGFGGIFLYCTPNSTVKSCTVENIKSEAIYAYKSTSFTVVDCKIRNTGGHALRVYGCKSPRLLGNTVLGAKGDGISCSECSDATFSGNDIRAVSAHPELDMDPVKNISRSGCGIVVSRSKRINVGTGFMYSGKVYQGGSFADCVNYGMHISLSEDTYVNKINISDIQTDGIHNTAAENTTIQGCSISGCDDTGISIVPGSLTNAPISYQQCKGMLIKNSTIENCGKCGIFISAVDGISVYDNNIRNCNDYGIYCNRCKNINVANVDIKNTKTRDGIGMSASDDSTNIHTDYIITLDVTSLSLGKGEIYKINSSAQKPAWTSSNTKVATVSGGRIAARGTGTAIITAKSSGREASCRVTVKNVPGSVALNYKTLTLGAGESFRLSAVLPSGTASAARTFRSSNSDIVRMTKTNWQGEFIAVRPGTAWVTVRLFNGREASCRITVKKAPERVMMNKSSMTLKVGQTASLNAVIPNGCASATRTYSSSNPRIVKMLKTNWTASFKAMYPGSTIIYLKLYNGKTASCVVKVTR